MFMEDRNKTFTYLYTKNELISVAYDTICFKDVTAIYYIYQDRQCSVLFTCDKYKPHVGGVLSHVASLWQVLMLEPTIVVSITQLNIAVVMSPFWTSVYVPFIGGVMVSQESAFIQKQSKTFALVC